MEANLKIEDHGWKPWVRALLEIRKFQKSTQLLIPKRPFYRVVKEVLQSEKPWFEIQATTILVIHEAAKAYLVRL